MRWIGNALVIIALTMGALSAATAYHVPLSYSDEYFQYQDAEGKIHYLTLNADAGVLTVKPDTFELLKQTALAKMLNLKPADLEKVTYDEKSGLVFLKDGSTVPLARKKNKLDSRLLTQLRAQATSTDPRIRQEYVIVQEFSLERWPGKYGFVSSAFGLVVGAYLLRLSAKRSSLDANVGEAEGPEMALAGLKNVLDNLRRAVGRLDATDLVKPLDRTAQIKLILDQLTEVQKTHMSAFVEARSQLIARFGLTGFAELMDHYAACERQVYRAWSAAADVYYEEAVDCLDLADEYLDEAMNRLRR